MPEISILLLTKNAGTQIQRTLEFIFRQETSRSFEVIAIDSGSCDRTVELLRQFDVQVHIIAPSEFNFGRTRELGYDLSKGDLIVTLSQDCVPTSTKWLEALVAPFADPTVAAAQGTQLLPQPLSTVFYWERINRFYFTRESQRWIAKYHFGFSNTNSAIRKQIWERNRLGAIEMCEDKLLQKKWTARNLKIVFVPEAVVYHAHDYDLWSLISRCENEGLGYHLINERYSFFDFLFDVLNFKNWQLLLIALARGEIHTSAEICFPILRPLFLWKGNRLTRQYVQTHNAREKQLA